MKVQMLDITSKLPQIKAILMQFLTLPSPVKLSTVYFFKECILAELLGF
jgi:hypothetical protein